MTELMKKYIEVITEERKNKEHYKQLLQEKHEKIAFIQDNENVFGEGLKIDLVWAILDYYDNDEQYREVKERIKKSKRDMNTLWKMATDEEKNELEQYYKK